MQRNMWEEMRRMQQEMDALFDNLLPVGANSSGYLLPASSGLLPAGAKGSAQLSNYTKPTSDIWETDKQIRAEIELPGVKKEDIKLDIKQNGLEIKVEKKEEKKNEDKKKGIYRLERCVSGYYRYFALPQNVDKEKVDAKYEDGVLSINIPKKEQEEEVKKIEIK